MRSDWRNNQRLLRSFISTLCLAICITLACSEKDDSDAVVNVALQIAQATEDDYERVRSFRSVAVHFAEIGDYARAIETADLIADTSEKTTTLFGMSMSYLCDEKYEEALHLGEIIEELHLRIWVASLVASGYADGGDIAKALPILRQSLDLAAIIEDDLERSEAIVRIAEAYFYADEKKKALQLLNQAFEIIESRKATGYDWSERSVLVLIAEEYAKIGEIPRASMVLNRATQEILEVKGDNLEYFRSMELWYIVQAYAKFDQCEEALRVAGLMKDIELRDRVTVEVVAAFAKRREYERAQDLVKKIENLSSKNDALLEVIRGYAREGRYEKARNLITELDGADHKVMGLVFVSVMQKAAGHDSVAFHLLSQARELAGLVRAPTPKSFALLEVAKGYAEIEQDVSALEMFSQVQQVVVAIQDADRRDMILCVLACKLAELGQLNQSLQVAQMISAAWKKVSALVCIAEGYHKNGIKPDPQARRILQEIKRGTKN